MSETHRNLAAIQLAAIAALNSAAFAAGATLSALNVATLDFAFRRYFLLWCIRAFAAIDRTPEIAARDGAAATDADM